MIQRVGLALSVFRRGMPAGPIAYKESPLRWPEWREGKPQWQIIDYETYVNQGFNLNTLVYSAVMYKARASKSAPLRAYTGDPENPDALPPTHPLSMLVARPNPQQSFPEFQTLNTVYYNVAGNCYVFLDRETPDDLPTALWPLRPDRTFIVPGDKSILGYIYVPEGRGIDDALAILPEDMMHIKLPNPGDPLEGMGYGLSPISPMAHSIDVDNSITSFLRLFFERGAMVTAVLEVKNKLNDKKLGEIKERWSEIYGGWTNWDEIGVLDQDATYRRVGLTFDEMGFSEQDERNETRILGPFGVPPILVGSRIGLNRSTYSNYEQARKAFWEDTQQPEMMDFEMEYKWGLHTPDGGFVAFDFSKVPAFQRNIPELVTAFKDLVLTGISKRQAAEVTGLAIGEMADGDVIYMPLNMVPVGSNDGSREVAPRQGSPESAAGEEEEGAKALPSPNGHKKEIKDRVVFSDGQKLAFWKQADRTSRSWEEIYMETARGNFALDERAILEMSSEAERESRSRKATVNWETLTVDVNEFLLGQSADRWRNTFVPLTRGVVNSAGVFWSTTLGLQFDIQNIMADDWLQGYTLQFADPISSTSSNQITDLLLQGQREGWSIRRFQNNLGTMFEQWKFGTVSPEDWEFADQRLPNYRTESIARTETIRAYNGGTQALYKDWGIDQNEWLTTLDGRQRDTHTNANEQVREVGAPFSVGGAALLFPGDNSLGAPLSETIQCRCTILPVIPIESELSTSIDVNPMEEVLTG